MAYNLGSSAEMTADPGTKRRRPRMAACDNVSMVHPANTNGLPVRTVEPDGAVAWRLADRLHRLDGPAFQAEDVEAWYFHGRLHRDDGPAVSYPNGSWEWRRHGQLHRVGGPARRRDDGALEWWEDGLPHRDDGPAYIHPNGTRAWCLGGVLIKVVNASD